MPSTPSRTAILVMNTTGGPILCPLFAKCDGLLLFESDGSSHFLRNTEGAARGLTDHILNVHPDRLLCGFISTAERQVLAAAGIDIRLGSCSVAVDELVKSFATLPKA